jgi:hypothetical protein
VRLGLGLRLQDLCVWVSEKGVPAPLECCSKGLAHPSAGGEWTCRSFGGPAELIAALWVGPGMFVDPGFVTRCPLSVDFIHLAPPSCSPGMELTWAGK